MTAVLLCALVGFGFTLGAIPFGVLLARRRGVSIQEHGSGNIGATNVARVLGLRTGAIVLLLDAAKGALPVATAWMLTGGLPWPMALTGYAAVLGHCFSPWLGGKGGKGVATAFGVFAVIAPPLAGLAIAVFAVVLRATRVPALGSLAGILAITVALLARGDLPFAVLGCALSALLVFTHRSNLATLR